ncbi:E3 ubiquitin-protein transferase rmnd5a [Dermatophagoides farinae]|uniref:E3 ubiquitin-protein transferase rmnd5a n=1 Tax=Dermatophagoides farinae TaxID=6954 RepID=A0A922HXR5_DERFA|nr:E3 ubiquitin-protein transferase rmnd5a [Dermatophagoides farinae]
MASAIENVEKETEKVLHKFKSLKDHGDKNLSELIQQIESYQRDLSILTSPDCPLTDIQCQLLLDNTRNTISQFSTEHRDIHSSVSRIGKAIDKNFISDYVCVGNESLFDQGKNNEILNKVIVEHFLRQGRSDIAEKLIQESKLDIDTNDKIPYIKMNKILDALRNRNLQPALEWAQTHRDQLVKSNSDFEFKLHRLQFIELLRGGIENQWKLITYSRSHFTPFAQRYQAEIKALMGSLMYLRSGIEKSPYQYLLDPNNWVEICHMFTKEACSLLEVSVDSPLSVTFNAGCIALPALINIKQAIQQRNVNDVWSSRDELPIEIDVTRKCHYHSIFACPILRQQSCDSNPPMRLQCGHVISRDALNKLSNGSKLKCPYCPAEQNPADARLIYF